MPLSERVFNYLLGASLIYWGIAGVLHEGGLDDLPLARIATTALNFTVGLLIIIRKPVETQGSMQSILLSIPSLICGGLLFKLSHPFAAWSLGFNALFIIGTTITIFSFINLGQSFAILPARRKIKTVGCYQLLRHPAYLGELIMVSICFISNVYWLTIALFILFVTGLYFRIKTEEKLLFTSKAYSEYAQKVKWRLIPFVW